MQYKLNQKLFGKNLRHKSVRFCEHLVGILLYSFRIQENTAQKNSIFGHFSCSAIYPDSNIRLTMENTLEMIKILLIKFLKKLNMTRCKANLLPKIVSDILKVQGGCFSKVKLLLVLV